MRPAPALDPNRLSERRPFARGLRAGLPVLLIVALGIYLVRFKSAPVTTHPVALGEVREEVLGTGTLEARVKTTISPRVLERIAEV